MADRTARRCSTPSTPSLSPRASRFVFTLAAADADHDPLTYRAASLPEGATLDPVTGILRWTPNLRQAGQYTIVFSASDGQATASQTAIVNVINTNQSPKLVPLLPQYGRENALLQFTAAGGDPDGEPVVRTVTNLPAGAHFNASTGLVTWTPSFDQSGNYTIIFGLQDPHGSRYHAGRRPHR